MGQGRERKGANEFATWGLVRRGIRPSDTVRGADLKTRPGGRRVESKKRGKKSERNNSVTRIGTTLKRKKTERDGGVI